MVPQSASIENLTIRLADEAQDFPGFESLDDSPFFDREDAWFRYFRERTMVLVADARLLQENARYDLIVGGIMGRLFEEKDPTMLEPDGRHMTGIGLHQRRIDCCRGQAVFAIEFLGLRDAILAQDMQKFVALQLVCEIQRIAQSFECVMCASTAVHREERILYDAGFHCLRSNPGGKKDFLWRPPHL